MTLRRALAVASVLVLAGVCQAAAQFPPPPGQAAQQGGASPFPPPPPGQASQPASGSPFPAATGSDLSARRREPVSAARRPSGAVSPFPPTGQAAAPSGPSPFRLPAPRPGAGPGASTLARRSFRSEATRKRPAAAIRAASARKATREEVCPLFKNFAAAEAKMVKFIETNQQLCGVPPDAVKKAKTNHAKTIQVRNQICSAGPGPRGPSLSDALGGPLVPTEPPKPGRGTFDTLTGPIAR